MSEAADTDAPLRRMGIAILSLAGLFVSGYLALYKLGYFGHLQCTTGGCDAVQESRYAYFFGVPVAIWGLGEYLALLLLSLIGVQPRWARSRWVAVSLFCVAAVGVVFTAYLTYLEAYVIHAWCQWCLVSAALVTLIFLLSVPELRNAR